MELYEVRDESEEGVSHSRKSVAVAPRKLAEHQEREEPCQRSVLSLYLDHMSDIEQPDAIPDMVMACNCQVSIHMKATFIETPYLDQRRHKIVASNSLQMEPSWLH